MYTDKDVYFQERSKTYLPEYPCHLFLEQRTLKMKQALSNAAIIYTMPEVLEFFSTSEVAQACKHNFEIAKYLPDELIEG